MKKPLQEISGWRLRSLITLASSLAFLTFGYDQGVLGGLLTVPNFLRQMRNPSPNDLSTITSIYQIGCCFGCLVRCSVL
jgi:hypothetical protein